MWSAYLNEDSKDYICQHENQNVNKNDKKPRGFPRSGENCGGPLGKVFFLFSFHTLTLLMHQSQKGGGHIFVREILTQLKAINQISFIEAHFNPALYGEMIILYISARPRQTKPCHIWPDLCAPHEHCGGTSARFLFQISGTWP